MALSLSTLRCPIVQAPLAGGASTVALAAAVSDAGGLGFLAAGYRDSDAVGADVVALREATRQPFAVNVFAPGGTPADRAAVDRYAATLAGEGPLGPPRHDDDGYADKVALLTELAVPAVSFTFGCPDDSAVARLHGAGSAVWVTVTTPDEARQAAAAGADALVVQGVEAGGHRGTFDDAEPGDVGLLALLRLVARETSLPMVAAGGIADGHGVAAVLAAGATAAMLGTAFMRCPEAGTVAVHRAAVASATPTVLTRAFTGRTARGIVNRFLRDHDAEAPSAYPEVHHLTAALRAEARASGDAERLHLWAGQAHVLARDVPAAQLVRELADDARAALREAASALGA